MGEARRPSPTLPRSSFSLLSRAAVPARVDLADESMLTARVIRICITNRRPLRVAFFEAEQRR